MIQDLMLKNKILDESISLLKDEGRKGVLMSLLVVHLLVMMVFCLAGRILFFPGEWEEVNN